MKSTFEKLLLMSKNKRQLKFFAKCKLRERIEHNGTRTLNNWQRNKET